MCCALVCHSSLSLIPLLLKYNVEVYYSFERQWVKTRYNLTVESMELDNPLHKDRATVIVIILDRNDNAPRFSQILFTELPEDAPVGDDIPFSIDITSGYITVVRPLDREMQDHYIVKVNANDSAWSVSTDVTIVITDINDNQPIFFSHSYTTALPETEDQEVFVMQVLATDADIGQNGQILYFIEPPNEQFWVNASSGDIYTKQPMTLHHPGSEIFCFTVFAYDCGNVPFHSNTTVTVRLEPYNHNPPVFLPLQPLMAIPYDIPIGSEVLQLVAIDQDFNNSSTDIEYVLNGGNASDFFWIQADSGKVTLNQILAKNTGVITGMDVDEALVQISIIDTNDAPKSHFSL
uniref:Cadherin domain-containing protein n=1 Tax=Myripristis murdjan TaxID=586833 RepID=A0A667XFY0_9TELE